MERQFRVLLNTFVLLFVVISATLVYWQVFWPTSPPPAGQDQNDYLSHKPCIGSEIPQRGNIYDRNGVLLAWSQRDDASPCGWRRYYATNKYPSIASFIGYYSPIYGASGIERYYNDILSGTASPASFNDAANQYWNLLLHRPTYGQDLYLSIDVRIQNKVDAVFQDDDGTGQKCDGTEVGAIIVSDPHTGQILAMDSRPYINPNIIGDMDPTQGNPDVTVGEAYWSQIQSDPCAPLLNRAVQGQYDPGSVFKTVTLLAALESGQFDMTNTTFSQAQATEVVANGFKITADPAAEYPPGTPVPATFPMDLTHAYAYSDNVIFARLGLSLGPQAWLNFTQKFAMSTPGDVVSAPIDTSGALPSYVYVNQNGSLDQAQNLATSAFGQGQLFLTPLTMSMVTNAVAADGNLYAPRLGLKVVPHCVPPGASPYGPPTQNCDAWQATPDSSPVQLGNGPIFSQHSAQGVRQGMRADIDYGTVGASGSAWQQNVTDSPAHIGGKTGTGQVSDTHPHPNSWFISLAPDDTNSDGSSSGTGSAQLTVVIVKENANSGAYESLIAPEIYNFALPLLGH
jgi:peptidoglycan glycosyltransferase